MTLKREDKTPLSIEVEAALMEQVKIEAKKQKLSLRKIVEYGFRQWLAESAAQLEFKIGDDDE